MPSEQPTEQTDPTPIDRETAWLIVGMIDVLSKATQSAADAVNLHDAAIAGGLRTIQYELSGLANRIRERMSPVHRPAGGE